MKLRDIKEEDYKAIQRLTKNEEVMKFIGPGRIWSGEKVQKFINYNLEEQKLSNEKREQFYYVVEEEGDFIGIIGFHLAREKYVLTIYFYKSKQGKGYFTPAVELLKKRINKVKPKAEYLYAQVHHDNVKMLSLCQAKFFDAGEGRIGNKKVKEFIIFLRKNTYYIDSEYIIAFSSILETRGNWKKAEKGEKIDLMYLEQEGLTNKKYQKIPALMKNLLQGHRYFSWKNSLYDYLKGADYLVENYNINRKNINTFDKEEGIWIVKPVKSFSGKGIIISDKKEDIISYVKNNTRYEEWVIQRYIENPMLYDNKKFHLRIYLLICDNRFYYFNIGKVALAKKMFKLTDFHDKDIHDTHFTPADDLLFPDMFGDDKVLINNVYKSVEKILTDLKKDNKFTCYPENKQCFELFAIDMMVTEDEQVKLLEINASIGMPYKKLDFRKKIFEAQMKTVVDSYFPPKKPTKKEGFYFTEV